MPRIIAVVGVSGVGKTTMLRTLCAKLDFQHLSAGKIIGDERARRQEETAHDELRLADINDNQNLLIQGFLTTAETNTKLVILDGHTVIHAKDKLQPIPPEVFGELGIGMFILIRGNVDTIEKQRKMDQNRSRPELSRSQIEEHQDFAIDVTKFCADELKVPFHILEAGDEREFERVVSQFVA